MNTRLAIASVVAAAGLALFSPATAHASEAGYLARISVDYGFVLDADSEPRALRYGYQLCQEMRNGVPRDQLARSTMRILPAPTLDQAGGMVFAAHEELCPDANPNDHGI